MHLKTKLRSYYLTAIFSVFFALTGFIYNTWRMEVTEDNNNIRTAAFEVLVVLAEFEQIVYAAHYDKNTIEGNPRLGWVKIGLAYDLSSLISPQTEKDINLLVEVWRTTWSKLEDDDSDIDPLVKSITEARMEIKRTLKSLD